MISVDQEGASGTADTPQQDVGESSDAGDQSYYQRRICSILAAVAAGYGNILEEEEHRLLANIGELEGDAQRLLFRLYLRRPGWFRVQKLEYRDVLNREGAVQALNRAQLIDDSVADPAEILEILQLEEMRLLARELGLKPTANRSALREAILATRRSKQQRLCFAVTPRKSIAEEADERILDAGGRLCGPLIRIRPETLERMRRLLSLFFLTSSQEADASASLATAILTDLNRRKYPPYTMLRSRPIFADRAAWRAFDEALQYERTLDETLAGSGDQTAAVDAEELVLALLATVKQNWQEHLARERTVEGSSNRAQQSAYFLRRYTAGWVYARILSGLVAAAERLKRFSEANEILRLLLDQDVYLRGHRGRWWERLAINWERHLRCQEEAAKGCAEGLADCHVRSGSRLALQRRMAKLESKSFAPDEPPETITIYAEPEDRGRTGRKLLYLLPDNTLGSVEELALGHFREQGWLGVHCESRLLAFIYTLCFWDIIFASVPDVFQTPYQSAPLDLATDAFYEARRDPIEARLGELVAGEAARLLAEAYYPFYGCQAVGALWREYPLDALLAVCKALGGPALAALLRPFAEDYSHSSSGLPDLFLYRPDHSDYLLVEVKSPNDRLSDAQRNWNALFKRDGIKFVLCRVLDTSEQERERPASRRRKASSAS